MAANVQDVIMLLGDSLTQGGWEPNGFAQRLSYAYVRKLDVLNRGFGGYQTDWAIPVFEQVFAKQHEQQHVPKVRILTIWYGANDASPAPSPQHVPLDRFKANLSHLTQMVTSPTSPYYSPDTRIILITPPPVNTYQWDSRVFDVTKSYAEAVKEVGLKEGLPVADIWTSIWEAAGKDERSLSKYLSDGLHLTAEGYDIVFNSLIKIISEKYPELHYDKLQNVFLPWDNVDVANPRSTLGKRNAILA